MEIQITPSSFDNTINNNRGYVTKKKKNGDKDNDDKAVIDFHIPQETAALLSS